MTFHWSPTQFTNLDVFRQYLGRMQRPAWVKGATIHHTAIPTVEQWRGLASMDAIGNFYEHTNGWDAGPHIFICVGSPRATNDGIFIGTPLDTKGIHAGPCNSDRWGVEVVGNYDREPWPAPLADLVYRVLLALATFGRYDPATINGHRECLPNKTCPGSAINMNAVRVEMQRRASVDWPTLWGGAFPYHPDYGIPQRWRQSYEDGKPLGKALTDELAAAANTTVQVFEKAAITWHPTAGTRIVEW